MKPRLTRSDILLLRQLAAGRACTVSGLGSSTHLTMKTISLELAHLARLGFVQWERQGQAKYFRLSDNKHARLFRNMLVHWPHWRYEDLLSGKSLDVLSAIQLLQLRTISEIEAFSNTSHVKVIHLLSQYRQLGAARKSEGRYRLGIRYGPLGDFLQEFRSYTNVRALKERVSDAEIIWERDRDVLLRSQSPKGPFAMSAFSVFPQFGIDLFMGDGNYYFYSPRTVKIGAEEACVHAMLAAEGPRERTPVILLLAMAKLDRDRFLQLARIYGAEATASKFLEYVDSSGVKTPPGFPRWREFESKLREYT